MTASLTKINFGIISRSVRRSLIKPLGSLSTRDFHLTDVQNGLRAKWRARVSFVMKERVDLLKEQGKYPKVIRSSFLEWNYDAELYAFGKRLNEEFDDQLLREALTDESYIFEETKKQESLGIDEPKLNIQSNKNLDRAGRALIEDFGTKYLRGIYPLLPEEGIESLAAYLVSDEVLGGIARELGFRDLILTKEHPPDVDTYARCFSAVVACLNVSSGQERCHRFILDFVIAQLVGKDLWDIWKIDDPHRLLRNILMRSGRGEPEPRLLGTLGQTTVESVFYAGIYDGDKQMISKGYGETPNTAVEVATYDALSQFFNQSAARNPLPFDQPDFSQTLKTEPNPSISNWKLNSMKENKAL